MATVSLESLVKPLSADDCKKTIYNVLAAVGVSTTGWFSGAVVRTMITAVAIVAAAFSVLISEIAKSGFLDLASGAWLTLVARYVYGVERIAATFARGEVTLTNGGGGEYTVDAGDLVVFNPSTGATYRNAEGFTLGGLATLTITVEATAAGSGGTSAPGGITEFETPLGAGAVEVTNAAAVVGLDEETDPALRVRCREKTGAVSPHGPKDAYAYFAKAASLPDGTPAGVTRVRVSQDGYGNVHVYCATAAGAVTGEVDDPNTALGAVVEAIEQNAAALCDTPHVTSATPRVIHVTYAIWIYNNTGLTIAQIRAAVEASLVEYFSADSTAPIGGHVISPDAGKMFHDALRARIENVRPEIFHCQLAAPSGDTTLAPNEVPTLGTVLGTVHLVEPGRV